MSDSEASASGSGSSSGSRSPSPPPAAASSASTSKPTTSADLILGAPTSSAMLTLETKTTTTFAALGLIPELCAACAQLGFTSPSEIQAETVPYALAGRDIIGLAQTGSGKTAAFALPILHALWEEPQGGFAVVMAPTRCIPLAFHPLATC